MESVELKIKTAELRGQRMPQGNIARFSWTSSESLKRLTPMRSAIGDRNTLT